MKMIYIVLFGLLVYLKITEVIAWSWLVVSLPLLIPIAIALFALLFAIFALIMAAIFNR